MVTGRMMRLVSSKRLKTWTKMKNAERSEHTPSRMFQVWGTWHSKMNPMTALNVQTMVATAITELQAVWIEMGLSERIKLMADSLEKHWLMMNRMLEA